MKQIDVHSFIIEKVDEIEDDELRTFINEILRFERSKLDREKYHYMEEYKDLIDEHASDGGKGESTDG